MLPYRRFSQAVLERLFARELEEDVLAEHELLELAVDCGVATRTVHEASDGYDIDAFELLPFGDAAAADVAINELRPSGAA